MFVTATPLSLSDVDKGYLAALIDGEGTIGIYDRPGSGSFRVRVSIANTCREVLDWVQSQVGGFITLQRAETKKHKAIWAWQLQDRAVLPFLLAIQDELKIKPVQCAVVLDFFHIEEKFRYPRVAMFGSIPEVQEYRQDLRDQMRILNRTGPYVCN